MNVLKLCRRFLAISFVAVLCGCGVAAPRVSHQGPDFIPVVSKVVPSAAGSPNSVASYRDFAFVSVQGTGQIFTYRTDTGAPVLTGAAYRTPCNSPSGMVILDAANAQVLAVPCYDTGTLLTLSIQPDGTLHGLGSVNGLPRPYPGITLVGTDVFVPLFGTNYVANGSIARVSLANPTTPTITAITPLASPAPGLFVNPGFLTVSGRYLYVAAGSESSPQDRSSAIEVVDTATMSVVGRPLIVAHSPQQIAIRDNAAFVTFYDAAQLQSIDISDPTQLQTLQVLSMQSPVQQCHSLPVVTHSLFVYIGCYPEGKILRITAADPANVSVSQSIQGIEFPQRLQFDPMHYLLATSGTTGGGLYEIDLGPY